MNNNSPKNQIYTCPMHPKVRQDKPGLCHDCGMNLVPAKEKNPATRKVVYTCPMHPRVIQDKPGLCPDCGMNLVPAKSREKDHGLDKHAGHQTRGNNS